MDDFNDLSAPHSMLATRRSGKARDMVGPGPDDRQLATILTSAMRVPDHGKLAPWRFITVATAARPAFAAMLDAAYRSEQPAPGAAEIDAIRQFAFQAPCLVIVVSQPVPVSQIPRWEQEMSAGAASMQLCNAAHAQGFTANWLTGWAAYSHAVAVELGIENGRIVAFIFIGTAPRTLVERPRPAFDTIVSAFAAPLR